MGFAPLVNWRNFTLTNLKVILDIYPDMAKTIRQSDAYDLIEADFNGYKKTAYQFACQLGLEDRSVDDFVTQNYLFAFDDENLNKYLEFWFKTYYAPNPFVKSNENSIMIYKTIAEKVLSAPSHEINFNEFFNNEIGGPRADILINCVENFGRPLNIKNRNGVIYVYVNNEDLQSLREQIELVNKFPMPADTKNRHLFFNRYSYDNFCMFWGIDKKNNENLSEININKLVPFEYNRIIFGAPGTGKSFKISKESKEYFNNSNYERVTFHPNYSYAQFVGAYKPKPKYRKSNEGKDTNEEYVSYEFVPGPFVRVWINAKKNKEENYLLIIEEINRANVASVFGDIFQLLDRKDDGESQYSISTSEELRKYLLEKENFSDDEVKTITIPNNMYIWSTMNSADQGVFPMDVAFKRRWNFEYIGINENSNEIKNEIIRLRPYGTVNWNELRTEINKRLTETDLSVNEDKLIGPFFLSNKELNSINIDEIFKSKLLMYLFEDVLKHRKGTLFKPEFNTFSKIIEAYDKKENVFNFENINFLYDGKSSDIQSESFKEDELLIAEDQGKYNLENK